MWGAVSRRGFVTSACRLRKSVSVKGSSSNNWVSRQLNDPYVEKAKMLNYRCRSAFKLTEIDERFHIFKPGQVVIDCGAAPGSWSQVAVNRVNSNGDDPKLEKGTVIAVDRQLIYPISGVKILGNADFTTKETQQALRTLLGGKLAHIVLSDMAPNATGVPYLDHEAMLHLCYTVLRFAVQVTIGENLQRKDNTAEINELNESKRDKSELKRDKSELNNEKNGLNSGEGEKNILRDTGGKTTGGTLLMKLWQCGGVKTLEEDIGKYYGRVKVVKPQASRSDSAEMFFLARDFKGLLKKV